MTPSLRTLLCCRISTLEGLSTERSIPLIRVLSCTEPVVGCRSPNSPELRSGVEGGGWTVGSSLVSVQNKVDSHKKTTKVPF